MSFIQIEFYIFLGFLYALLLYFKKTQHRKLIIILGNIYFYAYWDYRFLLLICIPVLTGFLLSNVIRENPKLKIRSAALAASLLIDLSILGYFKYFNWFLESFGSISPSGGMDIKPMEIILPLGLSFFIFRMISYTVDVYTGKLEPSKSISDFCLYATFFPIMVSGPISRARNFLPQLKDYSIQTKDVYPAFRLFVIGLFIKVFVADNLALFINYYYENSQIFNTWTSWLAAASYSIQIYCDFAGYSSMAIGVSLLLGLKIEDNFNFPYLSDNVREFWRRWHITLSEWIRDYIYIPLGGDRKGERHTAMNIMVAMTACGMWHGAALTFVLWGFIHGLMLAVNRLFQRVKKSSMKKPSYGKFNRFVCVLVTFLLVTVAWVFFRADSIVQAIEIINKLFFLQDGVAWYPPFAIFVLGSIIFVHIIKATGYEFLELKIEKIYTLPVLFCLLWLVIVFMPKGFQPFIYAMF